MAATTRVTRNTPATVTGVDILAILNRKTEEDSSFGDAVVDFTSDKLSSASVGVSRLAGALRVGVRNSGKHYALEAAVQTARSDSKLAHAAQRAADRINRYNGITA